MPLTIDNATQKAYNASRGKGLVSLGMITLKEYAERHGRNPATFRQKALRGGFQTAQKIGRDWMIDEDEPCVDKRVQSGDYIGWRNKQKKK